MTVADDLDAAWAQRKTDNITTLAWIANFHLDWADLDSIDEDPANFLFLQRASWCVHKIQLLQMMNKPEPGTWPPESPELRARAREALGPRPMGDETRKPLLSPIPSMAQWEAAPRRWCGDLLCKQGHGIVEDHEMRWCPGYPI